MGLIWKKNPGGDWDPGSPMIKRTTGWVYGNTVYKKTNATTWTVLWTRKNTKPNSPNISLGSDGYYYDKTLKKNYLDVVINSDASIDVVRAVFKYSISAYPKTPNKDAQTFTIPMPGGGTFSEFPTEPNKNYHRKVPISQPKAGTKYYFSAWVQDNGFNWSPVGNFLWTVPTKPNVPSSPSGPVTRSGTASPTDSASWNDVDNYWRKDNNYVYQGGMYWHGLWFYSTRINALLKKANKITKMTITVTRANTQHGVVGQADVYLTAHTLSTQPAGNPNSTDTAGVKVGTLGRGQTKTFNVPSEWWPGFLSGHYRGLGLYNTRTSFTDVRYLYAYGAGTTSGKVSITWEEGV